MIIEAGVGPFLKKKERVELIVFMLAVSSAALSINGNILVSFKNRPTPASFSF